MVNIGSLWQYLALHSTLSGDSTNTNNTANNLAKMGLAAYTLPALPYAYDALEPHISAQIMELHHARHHQAYVTNLNKALESHVAAVAAGDVAAQIALQQVVKFNGGGHINHSLFWKNLAPAGSEDASVAQAKGLVAEIEKTWGSFDGFKTAFSAALMGIQGSGWGWLVKEAGNGAGLRIVTTKDQDPVVGGDVPVFGVDMWEHAYYLQYLNGKAAYVENIWNVINWRTAEERFAGRSEEKTEL
ncbi:Manganese/iron superoxide dismutase [Parachaetomium inaequale]|uniref:Superoxide dismutase n=1 Tax=Parachaetomium inaequale TaxID=2588326 RepID=A0AAN6SSA6_9PEZI|nr:Manganese/iron superoxide dismutase [Parachaetomium inaequale]